MSTVGGIGWLDAVADRYKSEYTYDANGNIQTVIRHDADGHPYDDMDYGYHTDANGRTLRNRPYNIQDLADQAEAYAQDIAQMPYQPNGMVDPQDANGTINSANNFSYDALGQRTKDESGGVELIEWTAGGKVKRVQHTTASGKPEVTFAYDGAGNRIMKQVGDPADGGYREWYVLDAQGNIMATYRYTNTVGAGPSLKVTERPVYGSSRIGSYTRQMELYHEPTVHAWPYLQPMQAPLKRYELTDHLGNVAAVVTGRLLPGNNTGSPYQAELVSAALHEPFGLELTGMNWQSNSARWGFQNQIKDLELNTVHFKYREYRPAYGVFDRIDPLAFKYPWNSPYAFSENRVLDMVELEGLEAAPTEDKVPTPAAGSDGAGGAYSGLGDHLHGSTQRPSNFMADDDDAQSASSASSSSSSASQGLPTPRHSGGGLQGPSTFSGKSNFGFSSPPMDWITQAKSDNKSAWDVTGTVFRAEFGLVDGLMGVRAQSIGFKLLPKAKLALTNAQNIARAPLRSSVRALSAELKVLKGIGKRTPLLGAGLSLYDWNSSKKTTGDNLRLGGDLLMTGVGVICPLCGLGYFGATLLWDTFSK